MSDEPNEKWTEGFTDRGLMQLYQDYRDKAEAIALALESRGWKGEYLRGTSNEWKPLDPQTRPTQYQWTKGDES